ncbi:hypothetical protein DFH06DRAFT_1128027 [Mycena polygramma]|nr:hypothetical protein DFH06DRAFT_1128027 [Mycena polygramma]
MAPRVAEHSEDLGGAESADSAGLIGIGGGIVGDGTGTEGQRTIRTDRTCGSWKAGKCREPGGNPEGEDRRDRRTTNEEGEDVERGRMMTEATRDGRSIGSGETRKVNRDNRKRRKSRRRSKVDTEAYGGARGRSVPERPKSRKSREGRRRECAWPHGRKLAEKSFVRAPKKVRSGEGRRNESSGLSWDRNQEPEAGAMSDGMSESSAEAETPRSEEGKWKVHISQPRTVEALHDQTIRRKSRMGEEKKVKMGSLPHRRVRTWVREHASRNRTERKSENCHIVEFGLGSQTAQAGTGRKERMWKETKDRFDRGRRELGRRTGSEVENSEREWNEKSRSLMDQYSISEARRVQLSRRSLAAGNGLETRRLVEGKMNAKSSKVGSEVGSGKIREGMSESVEVDWVRRLLGMPGISGKWARADGMEEAAKGMVNRNNEKGRNLQEVHGEDPMGRTTRRKSSTCSETTNSDSASRRFGSEESEVGRCVRNRKSSAESVVGLWNPEVGSRIRNDKREDRRKTAQEVLVQSESANNSSEEKSEIIGKARKFEMPIPPLRVDVPSSSTRFQLLQGFQMSGKPEYSGLLARIEPEGPTGERREAQRARDSTAGEERRGCRSATGMVVNSSMQGSEGAEVSDEVLEEPKHLTNQGRKAPARTEANARMFGRVPMARAAEAEHDWGGITDRRGSGRKDEPEGAEQFPAKGCRPEQKCTEPEVRPRRPKVMKQKPKSRMSLSEARPRSGMAGQDPGTRWQKFSDRIPTEDIGRPDLSSEHENGKETANGGEQPRTTPDASAEASIGRSEVTNGRLESEPRKGDERWTEVRGTKVEGGGDEPQTKMPKRQFRDAEGRSRGYPKCRDEICRERESSGAESETMMQPNSAGRTRGVQKQIWSGSKSSERKETRKEQREEVATGSTRAEQKLKSSAEGVTKAQMIRTRVGGWNVHEEQYTRRWTEQSFEGVVEPWEVSAGGNGQSSEDPNKSREVEQLGRGERNGQTELRSDAADLYGNATYELQQHTRGVRNQSRAKTESSERNLPRGRGEWQRKTAELLTENRSTREMSGTGRTETEVPRGTSRRAAKRIEGEHRKLPEVQTEDWRGRPSEIPDSNGASETQGRKIWPGPGEDVWDFGKDVRDPERPESFSGASLGNRKSQNTIRTSVRNTKSKPSTNGKDRGRAEATGSTGRFGSKPKGEGEEGVEVEDEPNGNRANPMVRNELQKSEGRGEEPRGSGDKMPEVSETTEMEERKCRGIRDPKSVPENSLRLREEWKGGKEVVNDPDRSRSRGRAEDRRRPEISRVDGEVARANGSTEGQKPEVVRTEVGGRTEGEPEVIGTESK